MKALPGVRLNAFLKRALRPRAPNGRSPHAGRVLEEILSTIDTEVNRGAGIQPVLRVLQASKHGIYRYFCDSFHSETAAKALTLKVLNLCLGKYHLLARSAVLLSKPYGITVDPINNCNLACPGCVHSTRSRELPIFDWNSGMLSEQRYRALLQRFGPYAIQIILCNYGEPLLNPNTPKFIRIAKNYLIRAMLSTSMSVKRFDAEAYAASGLDFMTVSIDGATQPVYERYRKRGDLNLVLENVRRLAEAKQKLGRRSPILNWQFLGFEHNSHEIGAAIDLARQVGMDQFTLASPFDVSWDDPGVRPAISETKIYSFRTDYGELTIENWNPFPDELPKAEIHALYEDPWFETALADTGQAGAPTSAGHTCQYLYKNIVMDANGRILPCCAAPAADVNLVFSTLEDAGPDPFNAQKYQWARASFAGTLDRPAVRDDSEPDPYCFKCEWHANQREAVIDRNQVDRYVRGVGPHIFNDKTVEVLSSW